MDAPGENPSSSTTSRQSATSRGKDTDENDQEMGFSLQNPKKSTAKNFMSPTISAASKAALPKKKVLAERNQSPASNFSGAHPPKTPISDSKGRQKTQTLEQSSPEKTQDSDSKATPKNQDADCSKEESLHRATPLSSPADKSASKEELSGRPYDPSTNYLSPRPQFLRYNPNRRIEIFQRLKVEAEEEDDGVSFSSSEIESKKESDEEDGLINSNSSVVSSTECHLELENEEYDETEDDFEEVEEEKGWSLRGILQFLLVSVVLVLSTSYISSMNSPTQSPDSHAFKSLREGYDKFQTHLCDILLGLDGGYHIVDERAQMGQLGLNHTVQDEEMTENGDVGKVVSMNVMTRVFGLDDGGLGSVEVVEDVKQEGESEDVCEIALEEKGDQILEDLEWPEKEAGENNEYLQIVGDIKQDSKSEDWEVSLVATGEVSDEIVKDMERLAKETGEKEEGLEMVEHVKDDIVSQEAEAVGNNEPVRVDQTSLFLDGVDQQCDTTDALKRTVVVEADEEILNNEPREGDTVDGEIGRIDDVTGMESEVAIPEKKNPVEGRIIQQTGTELLAEVAIGLSICCVVLASLVSVIHIKRKKRKVTKDSSPSPVDLPSAEPVVARESSLVRPHEREEHSMPGNSFANSTPLINSIKEDSEEPYQSRAPTVQLLGEFNVGEVSSSLRSSDFKSRVKDSEDGSYSVSALKNRLASKTSSAPTHAQPEFSATISTSYGNFTPETKILRKQSRNNDTEGEDGEGREGVTTSLRRSARIRNRAVSYS
ncbi:hypothetical protein SLA2020_226100 [Shorea laevis]